MNILDKIVLTKREDTARRKKTISVSELKDYPEYNLRRNSLKNRLIDENSSGIIAEFKRKSPSKGEIKFNADVSEIVKEYVAGGAAGVSVLTDYEYFGGSSGDLIEARRSNYEIPVLRKDFIIDPYQIVESKAYGADVVLLIAACLDKSEAEDFAGEAKGYGLEVLMEFHSEEELEKLNNFVDMAGVNNRDLQSFNVDIKTSEYLSGLIPGNFVKVSESGLAKPDDIINLREYGYRGFLIGETFMKSENPGLACAEFIRAVKLKE
ncbi:MAG: indole-3-glycerol phosphate synthase TrpC [Prolixibacteraceae bacterium]|nr:indole-3-glycerol phosphate synthase TrpC [Prolixibacteraceae bacterium]